MSHALQAPEGERGPGLAPTRRQVLSGAAAVAVAAAVPVVAASPAAAATTGASYVVPSARHHLLRRAAYGPSPKSLADVSRLGLSGWVDWQLKPTLIPDPQVDALLARLPVPNDGTAIRTVKARLNAGTIDGWQQFMSVPKSLVIRSVWSTRQLQTVMEELWSDLFNVTVPHDGTNESRAHYQYTIRTKALGRFEDLLWGITRHPAMLTYLNNRDSTKYAPNENQGRELLELHSVGVGSGYDETDIKNAARILTGMSVNDTTGEFSYQSWMHWVGPVSVFGFSHPNSTATGGEAVAKALVSYLAKHPKTAQRVCFRIAQRFVSDDPSPALVSALAKTYLANGTAIAPVVRQVLASAEFAAARGLKVRRPLEHVAATLRALGIGPAPSGLGSVDSLVWQCRGMGQQPMAWSQPDGFPERADTWLSTATTLNRWSTSRYLVEGWGTGDLVRPKLVTYLFGSTLPKTYGEMVDKASTKLFGRILPTAHRDAVLAFLGARALTPLTANSSALTWRMGSWVALLLDTPYHLYR
ncbi:MAG: DUF1800 domain-containing protein [Candidatus Nanopelagicales bacterium]